MSSASSNGSRPRAEARQRSPRVLSSNSLRLRSSDLNRSRSVGSLLAVTIAMFGLLAAATVADREQRIQVMEAVRGF